MGEFTTAKPEKNKDRLYIPGSIMAFINILNQWLLPIPGVKNTFEKYLIKFMCSQKKIHTSKNCNFSGLMAPQKWNPTENP